MSEENTANMQRSQTTGAMARTASGTVYRMNKGLRAPRSDRSYDYLGTEDAGRKPVTKYNYMRNPNPSSKPTKSFDYLNDDQNRDDPNEPARRYFTSTGNLSDQSQPHSTNAPRIPGRAYSHSSSDTLSSEAEEEREDDEAVRALLEVIQEQLTGCSAATPIRIQHGTPIAAPAIGGKGANAGTVALIAVGFANCALNLHNTQKYTLSTPIASIAIMLGGGAQLIAGLLEFTKGNSFGSSSFMSYGAFWLTIACRWLIPNNSFGGPVAVYPTVDYFEGIFLQLFAIHSLIMCLCTFRMNVGIFFVFFIIMLTFLLTGLGNMLKEDTLVVLQVGGYFGIVSGALSFYVGFAELLNEIYDRTILPVFPMGDLPCFKRASKEDEEAAVPNDGAADGNAVPHSPNTVEVSNIAEPPHEPATEPENPGSNKTD